MTEKRTRSKITSDYSAKDIEVLEGLEPVRKRPGMYIGGVELDSLHHLAEEVIANSMDEIVAGYGNYIEVTLDDQNRLTVKDNGRGIPFDAHPKFPDKSALEVIVTTLHSGGKFSNKAYETAGGLHGVGISVVNALSDYFEVKVVRDKKEFKQIYSKGIKQSENIKPSAITHKTSTTVIFHPDPEIFPDNQMRPEAIYNKIKSKAYLFKGVEIIWNCNIESSIPKHEVFKYANGIQDYIKEAVGDAAEIISDAYIYNELKLSDEYGKAEFSICFNNNNIFGFKSYCNTINTPFGGTHETGFKSGLLKSIKFFGEILGNKKASQITTEDLEYCLCGIVSIFIKSPQFSGQTKDKLTNQETSKYLDNAVKGYFDNWLSINKANGSAILNYLIEVSEDRLNRKKEKETTRKTYTNRARLPGKLADCSSSDISKSELFIVEGDSAGGSAKQARNREFQAILPIRGKILNVASNSKDKITANQEITDLGIALGCGMGKNYNQSKLRYGKVIIMTDADVDGAHICSLLMAFFFLEMPQLIKNGHLYLAKPPLYRIVADKKIYYAKDDKEKDKIVKSCKGTPEISRFKGLGEMTPPQLKETTMSLDTRSIIKVEIPNLEEADHYVETLMGKKPELRYKFIIEESANMMELIKDNLDI